MHPDDGAPDDVLVIGGGPAGLTAAMYLGRFKRRVLVVEDGTGRASRIPRTHNCAGFPEGIAGTELVARMREHATRYGVRFTTGRVESLRKCGGGFVAQWQGGEAQAPKVILATGASDVPPAMPHLALALQEGALRYCPVCDGYEVIDQHVGVVADHGSDTFEAMYIRHFADRVTIFPVSEEVRFDDAQRNELAAANIGVVREPLASIRLWDGRVTVSHGDHETAVDSLYCALGMKVHSELAIALGAEHDDDGYLLTDRHQQTAVPGLYAVGDVVKGLNQISVAIGQAAKAASAIHLTLLGRL